MTRKQLGLWLLTIALLTGCTFITNVYEIVVPRAAVTWVASSTGDDSTTPPLCTDAHPCSVRRGMLTMSCSNNDVLELLGSPASPSIYQGANYMVDLWAAGISQSGTDNTHRCTVRARQPGGVVIDGQSARRTFYIEGQSYWTLQDVDLANSGGYNISINEGGSSSTGIVVQRVVAYNAAPGNNHVSSWGNCTNCLLEDVGFFGSARNIMLTGGGENGSIVRRGWFRWEGGASAANPSAPIQASYNGLGGFTFENIITVWNPSLDTSGSSGIIDAISAYMWRNVPTTLPDKVRGSISYAMGSRTGSWPVYGGIWANFNSEPPGAGVSIVDAFVDIRSESGVTNGPIGLSSGASFDTLDRATTLKLSGQGASFFGAWTVTNFNECNATAGTTGSTIGGCPDFYTGGTSPAGARNCFEYTNSVLGSTAATQGLWPWRMDDRIKAAIARAGATPLTGGAGSGYAAGTVTSEIAARYGPIPPGCSRTTTSFTPPFPTVSDFPSTPVLDQFTRADSGSVGANYTATTGPLWSIVSNQAAAPVAAFARNAYNAATFAGPHEVHARFPKMTDFGGLGTILTFAGASTSSDANQYRVYLNRTVGSNAFAEIDRVVAGSGTPILGPIDLGADVSDDQSFGVRVNATQMVTLYWKYSDGQWYRVGTVIDSTLPSANTVIGYGSGFGGAPPTRLDDFGGGTCCGGAVSPANIGRFGNLFPKQ